MVRDNVEGVPELLLNAIARSSDWLRTGVAEVLNVTTIATLFVPPLKVPITTPPIIGLSLIFVKMMEAVAAVELRERAANSDGNTLVPSSSSSAWSHALKTKSFALPAKSIFG